jgi:hypothetical protein
MNTVKQIVAVVRYNFLHWHRNPRILITFGLAFVLSFLLSDKAVQFAIAHNTTMQIWEAFIWTFGDSGSILLVSLLLILLFADMPLLSSGTPFFLMRINRSKWVTGQLVYTVLATTLFLLFVLVSTVAVCVRQSYIGNIWSETAAILGYSGAGEAIALPALVKTLEMSFPRQCMISIFSLMLCYTIVMVFIMMIFNLWKGHAAGIISGFSFSVYGFLLQPSTIDAIFQLPDGLYYKANVAVGWLSPLNHATYHMHNFGYDLLPRMWQSFTLFGVMIVLGFLLALLAIRKYNFVFTGTEG